MLRRRYYGAIVNYCSRGASAAVLRALVARRSYGPRLYIEPVSDWSSEALESISLLSSNDVDALRTATRARDPDLAASAPVPKPRETVAIMLDPPAFIASRFCATLASSWSASSSSRDDGESPFRETGETEAWRSSGDAPCTFSERRASPSRPGCASASSSGAGAAAPPKLGDRLCRRMRVRVRVRPGRCELASSSVRSDWDFVIRTGGWRDSTTASPAAPSGEMARPAGDSDVRDDETVGADEATDVGIETEFEAGVPGPGAVASGAKMTGDLDRRSERCGAFALG